MNFNSKINKELHEISTIMNLIATKKSKGETISSEEMNHAKKATEQLKNIVNSHHAEVDHAYKNSIKKMPHELAQKVNKKLGAGGITSLINRMSPSITPYMLPLSTHCILVIIGILTENILLVIANLEACGEEVQ